MQLELILKMASQFDEEECFKKYLEYEPKLRIHFFLINSLYDQRSNGILDCADVARQLKVLKSQVDHVIDNINQCSPDIVIIKNNPNYMRTIITDMGKNVLQYDISKLVPLEGAWPYHLEAICPSNVIKEYVRRNWLYISRSSKYKKYERGKNYLEFVTLYTSLCKFTETNNLTNEKLLLDAKLIKIVRGRLEIIRGTKFPSAKHEKLVLFYKLAVALYKQNFEGARTTLGMIIKEKHNINAEQIKLNNKIEKYNPNAICANNQHQNLLMIQPLVNNQWNPYSYLPQTPPEVIPPLPLLLEQPQKNVNSIPPSPPPLPQQLQHPQQLIPPSPLPLPQQPQHPQQTQYNLRKQYVQHLQSVQPQQQPQQQHHYHQLSLSED